jgi:hypothetical protein
MSNGKIYITSVRDWGSSNKIHRMMFLAVTSGWIYLMWVDCEIKWRGSRMGIVNKACLGLVTRTIGHSLCFRSTNENIPWSTARRRYLEHKDMPVTVIWGAHYFCVISATLLHDTNGIVFTVLCISFWDMRFPIKYIGFWTVTSCSFGRDQQFRGIYCHSAQDWRVSQARSWVWLTLWCLKWTWYIHQAKSFLWLTLWCWKLTHVLAKQEAHFGLLFIY